MRIKIRSKLILAISLLIVMLFSIVAALFVQEKRQEMSDDIYINALAFSKLTAPLIATDYDLYLAQDGFVYFNREIQSLFDQNDFIDRVRVISYSGEILYDSAEDTQRRHDGDARMVLDEKLLSQVKSESISIRILESERVLYLSQGEDGVISYFDQYGNEIAPFDAGELLEFLVVPASEKYSIVFDIDYTSMSQRVFAMTKRIIYLALFGVLLGIMMSVFVSKQLTRPISKLVKGAQKLSTGDFSTRVKLKSNDEIGFLGDSFNKMAADLKESMAAKVYKERVAHELELASEIQNRILPSEDKIPKIKDLDVSAGIVAAEEIGGDMYDFLPVNDNKFLMYLGDVTGHGVPAGLVSSIASALFYGYSDEVDLKKIMIDANRVLRAKTMPNMFITLCLLEWDLAKKQCKYISAGHEKILHYRAKTKEIELAPAGGVALGMVPDISKHVGVENLDLEVGDFAIIYSDGILEAWKNEHEKYGMDRLKQIVEAFAPTGSASNMKNAILEDVQTFSSGHKQMDDMTLIVVKRVS